MVLLTLVARILILCIFTSNCFEIYYEIPDRNISHCSRKLNANSETGCSSKYPSSAGEILISESATEVLESLQKSTSSYVVIIPLKVFINKTLIVNLRQSHNVAGLFVFSPQFPNSSFYNKPPFSENTECPNGNFNFYNDTDRQCSVNPKWNPPASEYGTTSWPFPVVLASGTDIALWDKLVGCYISYNQIPIDDTRCFMEIRNYMSGIQSSRTCYHREVLLSYRLEKPPQFCSQVGGVNIVLRAKNVTSGKPEPTILVLSRIDALSMFDRRASSGLSVLPAVSVIISAAVHLFNQPSFKAGRLRKNLLFAFLDNEALSFTGSQRFLFDLSYGRIAGSSGAPITVDSIESVIELAGIGLPKSGKPSAYYLLSDPKMSQQTHNVTSQIWKSLNDSVASYAQEIILLNGSVNGSEPVLLPPSVSTQALLSFYNKRGIPLSHTVISDRPGKSPFADNWLDSFLDTNWPPTPEANNSLLYLANILADALHREVTDDSAPLLDKIDSVTPAELMNCFLRNPGCNLLRMHLMPEVIDFLLSINGPIPMQTYDPVNGHGWRVSHIVANLITGLTGERLTSCPSVENYGPYSYMYGYYNGSTWCYKSLVETATSFYFFEDNTIASPGWVRSALLDNSRYVRIYRSASLLNDQLSLSMGVFLTALTGITAFLVKWFAQYLFIKPYDIGAYTRFHPTCSI